MEEPEDAHIWGFLGFVTVLLHYNEGIAHAYELSPCGRVIKLIQKGGVSHLLMCIPAPVFGTDMVCALWK